LVIIYILILALSRATEKDLLLQFEIVILARDLLPQN